MKKLKIGLGIAALVLVVDVGWQLAACEIASIELQDDMKDMASQLGTRIGFSDLQSDEQLRENILRKADRYDIPLTEQQITVERTGYGKDATIYLAADYTELIGIPGFSFALHFNPSTGR
jgi:hypothetical protein